VLTPLGDGRVPAVTALHIRENVSPIPSNWDLALVATMTDAQGLQAYLEHPDHVAAGGQLMGHVADAAIFDFDTVSSN
jgi:hypothetical protein